MAPLHESSRLRRIDEQERLVLTADLSKALAEAKDDLIFTLEDRRFVLRPRGVLEGDLRGMFSGVGGSLSSELIRERRAEAEKVRLRVSRVC